MDSESDRSRKLNCWDGMSIVSGFVDQWTVSKPVPNFEPGDDYCDALIGVGFNECSTEVRDFWRDSIKSNYRGEDGRRRLRMAAINLAERGSMHLRLADVRCPVLWLHVSVSISYSATITKSDRAPMMLFSPWRMPPKRSSFLRSLRMQDWCR